MKKKGIITSLLGLTLGCSLICGSVFLSNAKSSKVIKTSAASLAAVHLYDDKNDYVVEKDEYGNDCLCWRPVEAHGGITVRILRNCAFKADPGEGTFDPVHISNPYSPTISGGQIIAFEGNGKYKITQVKITGGQSLYEADYRASEELEDDTAIGVTNAKKPKAMAEDAYHNSNGYLTATFNTSAPYNATYPSNANEEGFDNLYIQATKQDGTRLSRRLVSSFSIYFVKADAFDWETPSSIEISADENKTTCSMNETIQFSAVVKDAGDSTTNVPQTIKWYPLISSDAALVGFVDFRGVFHPHRNGTVQIKAASTLNTSLYSNIITITVTGGKSDNQPVTFTADDLGATATKRADGWHVKNGFAINVFGVYKNYNPSGSNNDAMAIYPSSSSNTNPLLGYIRVMSIMTGRYITKVIINGTNVAGTDVKSTSGSSFKLNYADSLSQGSSSTSGRETVVTFSYKQYIQFQSTTTRYVFSITFMFGDYNTFTADSFADYVNGIVPDRDDVIDFCSGSTGGYKHAKDKYASMTEANRNAFQTSESANVVKARTRYLQWAAVYGDTTPFETTITSSKFVNIAGAESTDNTNIIIIFASVMAVSAFVLLLMVSKKRKHNK